MTDIFEEIFLRVKEATGIKRQKELADLLDIREASISEAKRRGGFPPEWIVKLSIEKGLNPAWLQTGQGPMLITSGGSPESQPEINVHEGVMMTTKVLSSKTGYANALWHNLKSFEAAVDREGEMSELTEKVDALTKMVASLQEKLGAVVLPEEQGKKRESNG